MRWLTDMFTIGSKMDDEMVDTATLLCCLEKVKSGTTCTVAMVGEWQEIDGVEFAMDAAAKTGIRMVLAGVMSDFQELPSPEIPAGVQYSTPEEEIKKCEAWYRKYDGKLNDRLQFMFAPVGFPASSPDLLKASAERARELKVRIHTHAAEGPVTRLMCKRKYGKGEIELLEDIGFLGYDTLLAHCIQLDDTEIKTVAKFSAPVAHCPSSNMKLASGIAPIAQILKEGGVVGLGVDGAASNNSQDMFFEMKMASLVQKGVLRSATVLPAYKVLEMATRDGAKAIGLENDIGSIEVGKKADIVLVDWCAPHLLPLERIISHLVYSARGSDVHTVVIDGKIVLENRRFLPFKEQDFLTKVQNQLSDFLSLNKIPPIM